MKLYLLKNGRALYEKGKEPGIPLFKLIARGDQTIAFLCYLKFLSTDLEVWYKGVIQARWSIKAFSLEVWLGKHGFIFFWPALTVVHVRDDEWERNATTVN